MIGMQPECMTHSVGSDSALVGVDESIANGSAVEWAAARRQPLAVVHGSPVPGESELPLDPAEARRGLVAAGRSLNENARVRNVPT
jgi:hypothetical protein